MLFAKRLIAVFLSSLIGSVLYAEGNTFTKVRYNGGSIASQVSPKEWRNKLTVNSEKVTLNLRGTKTSWDVLEIPSTSITSLSYGQEAHRRVGTMVALAVLVAPVALFGLLHKTRLHFIGVQFTTPDGKSGGILLQGDKDNYRAMLVALQGVSNLPVAVSEKDQEYVPFGINSTVTKDAAIK